MLLEVQFECVWQIGILLFFPTRRMVYYCMKLIFVSFLLVEKVSPCHEYFSLSLSLSISIYLSI